jgi:putative MATE family efflux protein
MKSETKTTSSSNSEAQVSGMFDGPILKVLIRLSLPVAAGMLSLLLYNITDIIWISRIDTRDPSFVGGTGVVFPLIYIALSLGNGIMAGVSALVARNIGKENRRILSDIPGSGLLLAASLSFIMLLVFYTFDDQLIRLLGASDDYHKHATEYLRFVVPGGVLFFITSVFFGVMQGRGQMSKLMNGMVIGTAANIVLDPVFIFLFKMNVKGAALATSVSLLIVTMYSMNVVLRENRSQTIRLSPNRFDFSIIKQIVLIGLPQSLGMIIMAFSFLVFNRIVIGIDPRALTSFSICGRIDQVVTMPIFAIAAAMVTMAGQNAGRGNIDRVRCIWRTAVRLGVIVVAVLATIVVIIALRIYPFFSDIPQVVEYAVLQTRIIEYSYLCAVIGIAGSSLFQAIHYPAPGFAIMLFRLVFIAIPVVLLLVYVLNLGIYGVWLGIISGNVVSAVVCWFWVEKALEALKRGKLKVLDSDTSRAV